MSQDDLEEKAWESMFGPAWVGTGSLRSQPGHQHLWHNRRTGETEWRDSYTGDRATFAGSLVIKKVSLIARAGLWLIRHGWHYRVTPQRTVVLVGVAEQAKNVWFQWTMRRKLEARLREWDSNRG